MGDEARKGGWAQITVHAKVCRFCFKGIEVSLEVFKHSSDVISSVL